MEPVEARRYPYSELSLTKLDQLRALREAKTAKVARLRASKAAAKAKPPKTAKPRVAPNGGETGKFEGVRVNAAGRVVRTGGPVHVESSAAIAERTALGLATGPQCPTCGKFRTLGKGFDRKAYMRDYMKKRRASKITP